MYVHIYMELPCPPPGELPDPGIEPSSLTSSALAGGFFTTSATWGALCLYTYTHTHTHTHTRIYELLFCTPEANAIL